jgi:non-specific serine/threonine protein kinase
VWLTELATLSEGVLVPQAVAATFGVSEQPGRSLAATLVDALRKKKMLLVLDNCEHLIDDVAHLMDTLLGSCPDLRVLATSREALGIAGEDKWLVPSLSLPDPQHPFSVENLARFGSARLFLERARSHHSAFVLTSRNVGAVAEICRKLDGIPLAVELAAARVGVLSVEQIAARLEDSLKLLTVGGRTAAPRQRTLRGALDWSFGLLSEPERTLFNRLSVFVGGWTFEAAEEVGTGGGIDEDDVLDLLSRLVDKSMVMTEVGAEGVLRYRMLEPARQYGRERLEASGEAEPIQRRHAARFLELAEEAEPELRGACQEAWLERLEKEHGNLRAALSWALERGEAGLGLQLSGALGEFWHLRGYLSEGLRWLEATLVNGDVLPVSARIKGLAQAGRITWEQGEYERSMTLSEESLVLSRELGDTRGVVAALSNLGWAALYQNELDRASTLTEEAITLQRASGDTAGLGRSLLISGMVAAARRDYERAVALHEKSLALARKAGDNFAIVLSLALGAFVFLGLGDYGRARDFCAEGLELSRQLKMRHLTTTHIHISAALAGSQGQPGRGTRLWGAAEALREDIGTIFSPVERHVYGPYIAAARAQLDEAAWGTAWVEGRTMTLEVAVEYALSEGEPTPTMTPASEEPSLGRQPDKLTCREREVVMLIGRGLTPHQISAELAISKRTVDSHVYKILKKLGFGSQVQIAAWVAEQRLVPSDQDIVAPLPSVPARTVSLDPGQE